MGALLETLEVNPAIGTSDLTPIINAMTDGVSAGTVATVGGAIIGGTLGIRLMWIFSRRALKAVQTVISGGKIRF